MASEVSGTQLLRGWQVGMRRQRSRLYVEELLVGDLIEVATVSKWSDSDLCVERPKLVIQPLPG